MPLERPYVKKYVFFQDEDPEFLPRAFYFSGQNYLMKSSLSFSMNKPPVCTHLKGNTVLLNFCSFKFNFHDIIDLAAGESHF